MAMSMKRDWNLQIRPRDHGNVKIHPRYVHHDEPIDTKLSSGLIVNSGGMGGSGV